jgi:hypothetical protein
MKIVLLADSKEPGISGIGDYSLELCSALQALNVDAFVESIGPTHSPARKYLSNRLKYYNADWLSFQFVPYAYASRGLVRRSTLPWDVLRGRLGTHIMFHEIWIGAHQGAPLRHRIVGALQRRGIVNIMQELRPDISHCSNRLYSSMLHQARIKNQILPLFGNIPLCFSTQDPYEQILKALLPGAARSDWVVAAFFGTIHPSKDLLPAIKWLQAACQCRGKRLLVVSLGHCPSAKSTFSTLSYQLPTNNKPLFNIQGKLDSIILSSWLRFADFALATTPFNLIEKSGSAIAFAEHGVPVIVIDKGADVRGSVFKQQDLAPDYWLFGDSRLDNPLGLPLRREPKRRLEQVARQFLMDLQV